MPLLIAQTDQEIADCFPALLELRPHLIESEFLARIRIQQSQGYQLSYALDSHGKVAAACGFRVQERLFTGLMMYIDDFVTLPQARGQGYGGALLDAVIAHARELGCKQVRLDSGFQRTDAHRLYLNHGFLLASHHFALRL